MKADDKSPQQLIAEQRLVLLLIVGFTTAMASFAGLMIALFAGGTIEIWTGFKVPWWLAMLVGGFIGFVSGLVKTLSDFKRSGTFTQQATEFGLARLSDEDSATVGQAIEKLIPGQDVRIWDCHFRADDTARIVIGDMGMESSRISRDNHAKTERQQTCFYIEFTEFVFPEFQLRPESYGVEFMKLLIGSADIDFADSPEFSGNYSLNGRPEEVVRRLFEKPVRDELSQDTGWSIVARKHSLVMFRKNRIEPMDQLDSFLANCLRTIGLLQSSAAQIPVESMNATVSRESSRSEANKVGGIVGALVQREIRNKGIESDDVAAFLNQPVPRSIPRALKNQIRVDLFLFCWLVLFSIGGTVLLLVGLLADVDGQTNLILMGIGSLIMLVGGSVLFLITRLANRRSRLLRHGRVREGIIEQFTETAFVNGNERVFQAKVRLSGDTVEPLKTTRIQGIPVNAARELHESGAITRVLQDPQDDSRIMLIECMAL